MFPVGQNRQLIPKFVSAKDQQGAARSVCLGGFAVGS